MMPLLEQKLHLASTPEKNPGLRLNIKTVFSRYGDSHVKDKTVGRPSYLYHGDPYTGKTTSLYWDGPLVALHIHFTNLGHIIWFSWCTGSLSAGLPAVADSPSVLPGSQLKKSMVWLANITAKYLNMTCHLDWKKEIPHIQGQFPYQHLLFGYGGYYKKFLNSCLVRIILWIALIYLS